ncbi:MAG: hypothetical protein K8R60_19250 [Burkholderiales bacterium]|nr:hypothetical protein [Burkholderiales bacterium]
MNDVYSKNQAAHDPGSNASDRLSRVHGAGELHAALLALLLPPGSKRAARAWTIETASSPGREGLREHAASLSGAARLPWFERLLARMARQPIAARQGLLRAMRRIMGARGVVRPIDRLHWLAMRRGLGEVTPLAARAEANVEVTEWLETDVLALAVYTAFLARMVAEDLGDEGAGARWYESVMEYWQPHAEAPPFDAPDAENVFEALARLQTLSWMQRPVVIRSWVAAALKANGGVRFGDAAADALRLTCTLLDTPMPPELERHYIALPADAGP